ncbi:MULTISPECIES: histidine kinase [unclassified Rhodococcus (in: high G+C Gram-positive bacteria)]|uniref:MadS family sensor histidine kinase n=1 Tax=unclassified Rhodococcus (in: high G+C Gram-positive bacteria) TaxID=192944 RepID=UPI0027E13F99|nr:MULTISPECIES: histidine kinase [unclassified Rhodococcus (in: high G+C Gram-positive bacteria)]
MTQREPVTDLSRLTGLRSSKSTYYPQYRGAAERAERIFHALDLVSRALVRTVEGPETLICAVAEAARAHLSARWVVFALTDGALPDAGPRRLVLGPDATPFLVDDVEGPPLPDDVVECLDDIRRARVQGGIVIEPHYAFVPIDSVGGAVGAFAAWTGEHRTLDATDGAVLSILASQTAVALQNSALFQNARRTAADLAVRNAELETTQRQLGAAQRHQVVDEERHRIARELHDSVTQAVLSAGMQIEVCRSEIPDAERRDRLDLAKDLTRRAVEQLRSAIYALNHAGDSNRSSLPEMLDQLAVVHMPDELQVKVNTVGNAVELSSDLEHAVLRIAGEALFNSAVHSNASRAALRLTYRDHSVLLTVDDDGDGDPRDLRVVMRLAETNDLDGSHRGLVNMAARVREFDGTFDVRRSRLGGIRIAATIPIGA